MWKRRLIKEEFPRGSMHHDLSNKLSEDVRKVIRRNGELIENALGAEAAVSIIMNVLAEIGVRTAHHVCDDPNAFPRIVEAIAGDLRKDEAIK